MISRVLIELLDASPESHASVLGWSHQNQLTWSTVCAKCLPIAILSEEIWIKTSLTLLCLPDIRRLLAFQSRQTFSWHIFRTSCVRTLPTSSKRSHLVYTRHWTSPNCRILWVYLNTDQKYTLVYPHCSLLGMDSLLYRTFPECIFRGASCHIWLWTSESPHLVYTQHWKSPSCSTPLANLYAKQDTL